jgi:hypothetical protein
MAARSRVVQTHALRRASQPETLPPSAESSSTRNTLVCGQRLKENPTADCNFKLSFPRDGRVLMGPREQGQNLGGSMAINSVRAHDGTDSIRFQPMERLKVYLFGATVLFASFGMGEAVYRLLFSDFDGTTDRIPLELLFGLVFAWLATKFVGGVYRNRKERSARLNFILARNHQIRGAVEGITPLAHPSKTQQSIRVIREEVDRIEWALKEILPG